MGTSCAGAYQTHKSHSMLNTGEVDKQLLKLIYEDLAIRTLQHVIIKETFTAFFHLSGLWSQRLFDKFDTCSKQFITLEDFEEGFNLMMKAPLSKRIQTLFDIYDTDGNGGISYNQFVKMMYSYPLQQLQQILSDQQFKTTLDKTQQIYFFEGDKITNLKEKYFLDLEQQLIYPTMQKSKSLYHNSPDQSIISQIQDNKILGQSCNLARRNVLFSRRQQNYQQTLDSSPQKSPLRFQKKTLKIINDDIRDTMPEEQSFDIELRLQHRNQSESSIISEGSKSKTITKKYKIVSRIAVLVKKYVNFLFQENELDKNKDELSKTQFQAMIMQHPKLLLPFQQGFHSYAWQFTEDGVPKFKRENIDFESQCEFDNKGQLIKGEMHLIKNTIFLFKKKNDSLPIQIKCLEGLTIQQIKTQADSQRKFGIIFKHKDGHYPEKPFYFKSPEILAKWLKILADYTFNTIHEDFQFDEIIGSGNYGKVYKAFQKGKAQCQSSEDEQSTLSSEYRKKQFAIKAIQKQRLNDHQYKMIKFQCSVLELLHHRNIVKFVKKYETRSYFYIVTQYFSQGDLFQFISMKEFLSEYEAAIVTKQLFEVASYLNELGVIHRDFKPENVMVITNEFNNLKKVKVIDFGLAIYKDYLKSIEPGKRIAGTPGFIAPQAFQLQIMDEKSDLFSIGIILYEMLCGKLPFQSRDICQVIAESRQCKPKMEDNINSFCWSKVSEQARDLISKLIAPHQKRINVKEALAHTWLQNIQKLKQLPSNTRKYYRQLKQFE